MSHSIPKPFNKLYANVVAIICNGPKAHLKSLRNAKNQISAWKNQNFATSQP